MQIPGEYRPRVIDQVVDRYLRSVGALVIEGPKWCGKTWTGMTHAQSVVWVADPQGQYLTRRLAESDPFSLLVGTKPVLIDEWQDAPGLWDAVRMDVDRSGGAGQYILTGSATPREGVTSHSGTGRMARLSMWPMSLWESGLSTGTVSLAALLSGEPPATHQGHLGETDIINAILVGGWPGSLDKGLEEALLLPRAYLESVAYSDASRLDGTRRDPRRLTSLLASLARNTATLVSNATLTRDMASGGGEPVSAKTLSDYLDVLARLHLLREIPAWSPALRSPARLRRSPKRILVDPSLAAAGMYATATTLAQDRKTFGFLFENLCLRDLSVYAAALPARLFHYHDNADLEVDAIIQGDDGRWAGVEIKAGAAQEDDGATALLRLRNKMVERGEDPPASLIVIVGAGSFAHRRPDGVDVVPIDLMGP